MNPFFDPSKMDPKVLMEASQLIRQLPPEQLGRMQSLMHNMMAGFDVRAEMEDFEKTLPPEFRDKMMSLMGGVGGASGAPMGLNAQSAAASSIEPSPTADIPMDVKNARITLLQAVADGKLAPADALDLLFPDES